MNIKKNTPCLFLRIPAYTRSLDVVGKHVEKFNKENDLWILKMGKKPDEKYLKEIIEKDGGLIIKSQSKFNNKYYFCKLESINPLNSINMSYPDYYNEIFDNMGLNIEDTFNDSIWFNVSSMVEVSDNLIRNFYTAKEKNLYECASHLFQVSYMYVKPNKDISI